MALKPRRGTWAYGADAHTPVDAARALAWDGPDDPGDWQAVTRAFRDGHTETWWAADASLGWWGPDGTRRLVAVTADPGTLPDKATWYLVTNLPRPAARARTTAPGRPRAWMRSRGSMGCGTGWSSPISRSRTSWAGPTSRSAPTSPSAATRCWSTARSPSAGPPGRPHPGRHQAAAQRGGIVRLPQQPQAHRVLPPVPSWPHALRAVRSWLTPAITLT